MKREGDHPTLIRVWTTSLVVILTSLACGGIGSTERATPVIGQQPQRSIDLSGVNLPVDSGVILFQDDFQDGEPQDWETSGGWFVEQQGDVYVFGTSGRGYAWVPTGHNWSNYLFHAGVRLETGALFLSMNLTSESRYMLRLNQDGAYLIKEQPVGNLAILAQTGPVSLNTGHSIVLASQTGHLQMYVDDALWMDVIDTAQISQGTIGVSSLEGSRVAVDNILVAQPTGSLPVAQIQAPPPDPDVSLTIEQLEDELDDSPLQNMELDNNGGDEVLDDNGGDDDSTGEGLPDLVVNDVHFEPDPVVQGQQFTAFFAIANQGSVDSGAFTVRLHFHANTGLADCNWDYNLPAGTSVFNTCLRTTNSQPGNSPTEFTVDVEEEIQESNEENNFASPTLTVTQVVEDSGGEIQAALPDLVINSVAFTPDPAIQGQEFAALVLISNNGDALAGIFTVRLHFHPNTEIPDCNWDVDTLGAGGSIRLDCTRFTNADPKGYRTDLTVDVEGEIQETEEGNNASNQPLTVAAP